MSQMTKSANTIKCVIVGDGACGKTCMLISYTIDEFPQNYKPTVFDSYTATLNVNEKPMEIMLVDTAGQDGYEHFRALSYPYTDIFLICFSVVDPGSFKNAKTKWYNEIKSNAPDAPIILVGSKIDLRAETESSMIISKEEGKEAAKELNINGYVECSSLTQENLKEVFDEAIVLVLDRRAKPQIKKRKRRCKIL